MPPTPRSEGKARAIRELSRELSHSPRSLPSPSSAERESNPTLHTRDIFDGADSSSINPDNDEIFMSTRQFDDEITTGLPTRPRIRSTAKKVGAWTMAPHSDLPVDTSMVNKEFEDFDQDGSEDEDVSISIEQARGGNRSNHSTPRRLSSSFNAFNSLYDMTPPGSRQRKGYGEVGSLRRDAQVRRASQKDFEPASTRKSPANKERKRQSLAQLHARLSEEDSTMTERPPTMTAKAPISRFNRPASTQLDGTPRPGTATNATAQSFMLPDLPNLTELVSGVFQDGAPVFSKTTPARNRFAAPNYTGRAGGRQPNHVPVDSVPIPEEEKAIFASLHMLKEKVAQLERENAEAEKRIEEQDLEIIELKASKRAQENATRNNGLRSSSSDTKNNTWTVEKTSECFPISAPTTY